jgi:anti-anti-sigma factor
MVRLTKFEIAEGTQGSALVLSVTGELDMNTVPVLSDHVERRLSNGLEGLVIDLSELAFMDSSGLRLLIELNDRSLQEQWTLTLVSPRGEAAAMVLRATGADTALPFEKETGR